MKTSFIATVSLLFFLLSLLEYQAKHPLEVGFSQEQVVINTLFKRTYGWKDFNNVILKDGLLTLFSSGKEVQFVDERQLSDTRALLDHCQLDVKFVHAGY